ncbi:beta-D-xylosidase [Datura stramonium]|uniref:Beta-D-xylosidase n=1 Tax=Datura stramonium TaxID=4076 RepID=A0ABS8Y5V6_DATST|nr:beta-D-xylosidase [Datura stramonium]
MGQMDLMQIWAQEMFVPAHQQLALQAAHEGIVLLKNIGQALPLSPPAPPDHCCCGPNSDATVTMIGNYADLQGIARYAKAGSSARMHGSSLCRGASNLD